MLAAIGETVDWISPFTPLAVTDGIWKKCGGNQIVVRERERIVGEVARSA